jgi:hypothetical protein
MEGDMDKNELKTTASHPDAHRSRLRAIMARIDGALPETPALQEAWRELGTALALGPEPETRVCHACRATVMRGATRCGHCWTALAKLPDVGS